MKIVLIGAGGDIGMAVRRELEPRHDLITAGRTSGDIRVDMADMASVRAMYAETGPVDAVVSAAGNVHFGLLPEFTEETFMLGLKDKVMGQVNLVLAGLEVLNDNGSFTLTSGVLDRDPVRMGAGAATANGALGGFVVGAAIEMPRACASMWSAPAYWMSPCRAMAPGFQGTCPCPLTGSDLPTPKALKEPSPVRSSSWNRPLK